VRWKTYPQIWDELQLTRGAMDVLVQAGKLTVSSGLKLLELAVEGGPYAPEETYYEVSRYYAGDAAARLCGELLESGFSGYRFHYPNHVSPTFQQRFVSCPSCGAQVNPAHVAQLTCPVCTAEFLRRKRNA
jgi:hypothetical protein